MNWTNAIHKGLLENISSNCSGSSFLILEPCPHVEVCGHKAHPQQTQRSFRHNHKHHSPIYGNYAK